MLTLATWFLLVNGLAWLAARLLAPTLAALPDRGAGLSKVLGVLGLGLFAWAQSAVGLGGSVRAAWVAVALAVVLAAGRRSARAGSPPSPRHAALVAEGLFLGVFLGLAACRSLTPDIIGGEKWMDFGLLNATMRADALPPIDPWFSGEPVNYYYFGYVGWALVATMSATPPAVAYNLTLATLGAQLASAAFSVVLALTGRVALAAGGALLLVSGGSLALLAQPALWSARPDFFATTRVVAGAITEFPVFALTWGDLHPHVMNAPLVVAFVGLLASWLGGRRTAATAGLAGAVLGGLALTSPWDAPLVAGLTLLLLLPRPAVPLRRRLAGVAVVAIASALVCAPFFTSFVAPPIELAWTTTRSSPAALALAAGPWLVPVAFWLISRGLVSDDAARAASGPTSRLAVGLGVLALAAWAIPEVVYLDDAYESPYDRMNTVFKLHWQAVLYAGLLVPLAWQGALAMGARWRFVVVAALGALAAAQLAFPAAWTLVHARAGWRAPTLDGHRYLRERVPSVFDAVTFFQRETRGQPVIAEATGDSYGFASRISANTGVATVLGWRGHEALWRGHSRWHGHLAERERALDDIYTGSDAEAWRAIRRYGVRFVVVGGVERARYPTIDEARWTRLGRLVLASGALRVYEIAAESRP